MLDTSAFAEATADRRYLMLDTGYSMLDTGYSIFGRSGGKRGDRK
jgi:hypothetical protein